jgi:hypothetical protein
VSAGEYLRRNLPCSHQSHRELTLKKITIIIEIYEDESTNADPATIDPEQPYPQDDMEDMLDDYD